MKFPTFLICGNADRKQPRKRQTRTAPSPAPLLGEPASAAADETEARAFFTKFVAAQNAHNADDVKAMLWNSPSMLWFSRGVETRGRDAVADRFREYYEGTWHLEPDMSQFHASVITDDVMQILVPIIFTRGLAGKPPQDNTFLISQTLFAMQMAGMSRRFCRSQTPNSNSPRAERLQALAPADFQVGASHFRYRRAS